MMKRDDDVTTHNSDRYTNLTLAEFVVVPPEFNIEYFMSMREKMGMFSLKEINAKEVEIIAMGIANSPVFSSMNNRNLNSISCMFVLDILDQLNLVLRSIPNPLRRDRASYAEHAQFMSASGFSSIRMQQSDGLNFLIVNMYHVFNQNIIDQAWEAIQSVEKFQEEIKQSLNSNK